MPYRRRGKDQRRGLYTHVTLPKFGLIRKWTGVNDIRVARAMEAWLLHSAVSRPQAVQALVDNKVNLPHLWIAKIESTPERDRIAELLDQNPETAPLGLGGRVRSGTQDAPSEGWPSPALNAGRRG